MEPKKKGRKPSSRSVRWSGWRAPLLAGEYALLVDAIGQRQEYRGLSPRAIVEAALQAYATAEEKDKAGM